MGQGTVIVDPEDRHIAYLLDLLGRLAWDVEATGAGLWRELVTEIRRRTERAQAHASKAMPRPPRRKEEEEPPDFWTQVNGRRGVLDRPVYVGFDAARKGEEP